jgi:LysM repeat protein
MERAAIVAIVGVLVCAGALPLQAQSLRGSPQAMQQQNRMAQQHDFTFLRTGAQVRRFVESGYLVKLPGNADYQLASVSYPYARPAVKLFVERLASQYHRACGERLVVTSLTRPVQEQPRNASSLSVHPAGMAVDLRVSGRAACRNWLERTLLSLEREGVLNAIRENRPPHYHVALYPNPYTQYVARLTQREATTRLASDTRPTTPAPADSRRTTPAPATAQAPPPSFASVSADPVHAGPSPQTSGAAIAAALSASPDAVETYRINRGDSLWSIARRHGTTVDTLKALNNLRSTAIVAGQVISVPAATVVADDTRP